MTTPPITIPRHDGESNRAAYAAQVAYVTADLQRSIEVIAQALCVHNHGMGWLRAWHTRQLDRAGRTQWST